MDIAAVIIVYNHSIDECETGQAVLKCNSCIDHVVVFDNSTIENRNREICDKNGWVYLSDYSNVGLPKAYNRSVSYLRQIGFDGVICVFDDDTEVSRAYFEAVQKCAQTNPDIDLFYPLLKADGKVISPVKISYNQSAGYFDSFESCKAYQGNDLFAFNSAMAIRTRVFDKVSYNEELFLDGVDYDFLLSCYQHGFKHAILSVEIEHGFSGSQKQPYSQALWRFENYAKDYAVVLRDNPSGFRRLVGKRALHLMFIYKRLSFLKLYINNRF